MITCEGLAKIYRAGETEVFALQGLDLAVSRGEWVAIVGNSGSGKSTLMNVLGGLDAPSAGHAQVADWDLTRLTSRRRDLYRRSMTGFLWQNSALNLVPYLTVIDNILLAMRVAGPISRSVAQTLLEVVGLEHKRTALPTHLSGGEQQRAAVAVALANQPPLLLADEPTGALDSASAELVMAAFRQVTRELGTTILMVTHDPDIARHADRTVRIRDGKVAAESVGGTDEVVVLDSAGRLQIPRPMLTAAGIASRAEVTFREGAVLIRAPQLRR